MVTVISSDELHWTNGLATGLEDDPPAVGKQVAEELLPHLSTGLPLACLSSDGLTDNFDHFIAGLEENPQTTNFSRSGVGELATTTMRRRQPDTATTRSSPMGSLTAALGRGANCLGHQP